jgi:hypothetical protein
MSFFTPFETGNWKAIITHMCHILGKGGKTPDVSSHIFLQYYTFDASE